MIKVQYTATIPYFFNPNHKGAHYSFDNGKTYKNNGEFLESAAKHQRNLEYLINPATAYDQGSDIESLNASVKTPTASLACIYGNDKNDILEKYFKNVYSTLWIFMFMTNETVYEYHMNKAEFQEFLQIFGKLDRDAKTNKNKIRIKNLTKNMLEWLEDRV